MLNRKQILVFLIILLLTPVFILAENAKSLQSLQNDISYYKKISSKKSLTNNDRYYILLEIEKKYKDSGVNLSQLHSEINKLSIESKTPITDIGTVSDIYISETDQHSKIIITANGITHHNYFILRSPEPNIPPKIVLDLSKAKNKVSAQLREIRTNNGIFKDIRTMQFKSKPEYIVRLTAEMRKETPYKVYREKNKWIIQAEKEIRSKTPVNVKEEIKLSSPINLPTKNKKTTDFDINSSTIPGNYIIEVGDILGISVFPAEELSRETVVQADGKIPFPLIGSTKASGISPKQLEESMTAALNRYISNPQVMVTIKQFSRRQVFVTGEVRSVGAYNFKENLRLLELISALGGFTENANRKEISIFRDENGKRQIHSVNVEKIIMSGDFSNDFILKPGDIVEVAQGRSRVAILGDVRSPGYYDFRENLHLLELMSLAGGFNDTAQLKNVTILRQTGEKDPLILKISLKQILSGEEKDVTVNSGDTVYIPKKNMASSSWFVNNLLPWLSLFSLVLVIRAGI